MHVRLFHPNKRTLSTSFDRNCFSNGAEWRSPPSNSQQHADLTSKRPYNALPLRLVRNVYHPKHRPSHGQTSLPQPISGAQRKRSRKQNWIHWRSPCVRPLLWHFTNICHYLTVFVSPFQVVEEIGPSMTGRKAVQF